MYTSNDSDEPLLSPSCPLCDAIDQGRGSLEEKSGIDKDAACHLTAQKGENDDPFETGWICLGKMVSQQAAKGSLVPWSVL